MTLLEMTALADQDHDDKTGQFDSVTWDKLTETFHEIFFASLKQVAVFPVLFGNFEDDSGVIKLLAHEALHSFSAQACFVIFRIIVRTVTDLSFMHWMFFDKSLLSASVGRNE